MQFHKLLAFTSTVQCMKYVISYFNIHSSGLFEPTNDQLPTSVASQHSWLECRTGIARSQVQTPVEVLTFCRLLYTQLHKFLS